MTISRFMALGVALALTAPSLALAGTDTGNPAPANEGPYGLWSKLVVAADEGPYGARLYAMPPGDEGPYGIELRLKCAFHWTAACDEALVRQKAR